MERHVFAAMGTTIELLVHAVGAESELAAAEAEFERLEQVMSRFRPDSELCRLNCDGSIDASRDLAEVVARALEARERTQGRFDPTVHDALVAAGYDRTYADVPADGERVTSPAPPCGGGVSVDGLRIELEPGVRLDLGGIGKGFAAERAAELLSLAGPCLVSAGGDVAVRGLPPDGVWTVGVDDGLTLGLERGGLATSGTDRRRWRRGGRLLHHVIDPATGEPVATDLLRVTALGADAVEAEVRATALLVGGGREAAAAGVPAVLVAEDGSTRLVGGLA
jgi:thiamine biosynthesis lipoprotein